MEYKYYKLMTKEDKEEYDYTYGNTDSIFDIINIPLILGRFFYRIMVLIILLGILLKDYFPNYEEFLANLIIIGYSFVELWFIIFIACVAVGIVATIVELYFKHKWLKNKGYNIKFKEHDLGEQYKKLDIEKDESKTK